MIPVFENCTSSNQKSPGPNVSKQIPLERLTVRDLMGMLLSGAVASLRNVQSRPMPARRDTVYVWFVKFVTTRYCMAPGSKVPIW